MSPVISHLIHRPDGTVTRDPRTIPAEVLDPAVLEIERPSNVFYAEDLEAGDILTGSQDPGHGPRRIVAVSTLAGEVTVVLADGEVLGFRTGGTDTVEVFPRPLGRCGTCAQTLPDYRQGVDDPF